MAQIVTVSSGYFEALRARLLAGRFFTDSDTSRTEPVVVINQTLGKQAFPGSDPVGQRVLSMEDQIGPLGRNLMFPSRDTHAVPFRVVGRLLQG